MDKIIIRDLRVRSILGINPDERVEPQDILINIVMFTDISAAATADDVSQTIDYYDVSQHIVRFVAASRFYSVERLTEEIAAIALNQFGAQKVIVRVEKPTAVPDAASVGVEIERSRNP